jgi:hypothetical protein
MSTIAISPLARTLNKIREKVPYYLATSVMVVGSTLGTMNAANADNIAMNGNTLALAGVNEADDVLVATNSATAFELQLDDGDVTVAGITQANSGAMVMSITDNAANGTFTVTGNITAATAALTIQTDDNSLKLSLGGNITEDAVATLIKLDDTGIVEFTGTTKNIDAVINGIVDNEGTMTLAGVTEFDDAIGATKFLKAINVSATKSGDFNGAVDSTAITNLGTLTFSGALGVDTLTNSGTVNIQSTSTNVAAGNEAAIVMHTTGSILNFNGASASAQDAIITATTDGFGTINVFDATDDALGGTTTLAADALIGASGTSIGTLNVGKSDGTKSGNLTTADGSAMFIDNINITGGNAAAEDSTLSLIEAVTATNITLTAAGDADATLKTLTATTAIAGAVDSGSGTDGAGFTIIDADIATQFSGNVGASVPIEKMDIAAIKVDLDGATNQIESVLFSGNGDLEFGTGADQTFTGAITATTNEHGQIFAVSTTGTLTMAGQIGAENKRVLEVDLADNTDTTFTSAIFAKDFDVNTAAADDVTTFEVGGHVIGSDNGTAGALDVAGGTFILGTAIVDGVTLFNTEEVNNADAGVELRNLVVQPSANFTNGTVTFIDGETAATIAADDVTGVSVTDTALTDFTVNITAGTADVTITAAAKTAAATGKELGITDNQGTAIQQVMEAAIASDTTLMNTLNASLTGVNSGITQTTTDLAKQASPQTDLISGSSVAAQAVTGSIQGIMSNRMASLRSGDAYYGTGVAAGGMSAQSGFIQVFGSEAEQKSTKVGSGTQDGFDSETQGLAIGFDGVSDGGMTIGVSVATANTDVDGKGTGKSVNSIDTYSAALYMDRATDNGYVEGSLTFGVNENSTTRKVTSAGLNRTYTGSYDSQSISLNLTAGVPNEFASGYYITPFGSFSASTMNIDAYTEKSTVANDALRLKVAQDDINSMIGTVGLKYHAEMDNGGMPMISLAVNNEFGDSTIDSNNTFQGGGTVFKTSTAIEELSATLGLGYVYSNDSTSIEIGYEADANDDKYLSHYGSIKIVGKF